MFNNFLATIVTIFVFALWTLPIYYVTVFDGRWGILYLLITFITVGWIIVIEK